MEWSYKLLPPAGFRNSIGVENKYKYKINTRKLLLYKWEVKVNSYIKSKLIKGKDITW